MEQLQLVLPRAKVIYSSATGASEPTNLVCALWAQLAAHDCPMWAACLARKPHPHQLHNEELYPLPHARGHTLSAGPTSMGSHVDSPQAGRTMPPDLLADCMSACAGLHGAPGHVWLLRHERSHRRPE